MLNLKGLRSADENGNHESSRNNNPSRRVMEVSIKATLLAIWRDVNTEPVWQYQQLSPFQSPSPELKELTSSVANDSELSRAVSCWLRRPKSILYDRGTALAIEVLCVLLSLIIAVSDWPSTSISDVAAEVIILVFGVAIEIGAIAHRVRFVRWRREYHRSVNRLFRTIYPAL